MMAKLFVSLAALACLVLATEASITTRSVGDLFNAAVSNMLTDMPEVVGGEGALSHTRNLLQSGGQSKAIRIPSCIWDGKSKECGLNPLVAVGFLTEAPKSDLRDLIVDVVRCGLSLRKDVCLQSKKCRWVEGQCGYETEVADTETISDCIGEDSAVFLESGEKEEMCRTSYATEDSCNIASSCSWHGAGSICKFDAWKLLTGVPSDGILPRGIKPVTEARGEELEKALKDTEIKEASDILTWTIPPFQCPDGVDLVVCHTAEQADKLIVTQLYCAALTAEGKDCDSDAMCSSDGTDTCSASITIFQEVATAQLEAYLSAVSDPTAADLLRREVICFTKPEATCKTESCMWNPVSKYCTLNPAYMMKRFAERPVEKPGALCQVVTGIFESGCLQLDSEDACATEVDSYCMWDNEDDVCIPGPQVYMDILFSDDKKLEREVAHAAAKCQRRDSKEKCKA